MSPPILTEYDFILHALNELKAEDVVCVPTTAAEYACVADYFVIATATSNRHASALLEKVRLAAKEHNKQCLGIGGEKQQDGWLILDLVDVVVHIFLQQTREHYALEKLWQIKTI